MSVSWERIKAALEAGEYSELEGDVESDEFEVKRQPYDLNDDRGKLELVKDVSAFANAKGGILLIGFATSTSELFGHDEIVDARPFPLDRFDTDRYRKVIADWTWPPMEKVEVSLHATPGDPEKGVAAIVVPPADEAQRPVLIAKSQLGSRRVDLLVGYCERKQDRVTHYDLERFHGLLRDGRRFDAELRSGFAGILAAIEKLAESDPESSVGREKIDPEWVRSLRRRAIQDLHFPADSATFTLTAAPQKTLDMVEIVQPMGGQIAELLESPPTIRASGFDLGADGRSSIFGRFRRSSIERYKLLEVHREGVIIFVTDGETLGHGRESRDKACLLINQLALVEMVYLFCHFVGGVLAGKLAAGDAINLELQIKGAESLCLEPGALLSFPKGGFKRIERECLSSGCAVSYGSDDHLPAAWAFELLSIVYSEFSLSLDQVPYSSEKEGRQVIDPQKIIRRSRR